MQQQMNLHEYADILFGDEDPLLRIMREEAQAQGLPTIQIGRELGRLLEVLILATGARRALEIGTLFGYSGVIVARALPADGTLTTLEVDPKHAALARQNFERAGVASKVTLLEGNALESLGRLERQSFDFVFIDADKVSYSTYLDWALKLTRERSVIVSDNVWRQGSVTVGGDDAASSAMARFNAELVADTRLATTFFSTRGGADAAAISVVRPRQ